MRALRKSEFGRRIADFIDARHVHITTTDENLAAGVGAVFLWVKKEIQLPRDAAEIDATILAVSLAHEGYHAMQAIGDEMVQCIEAEQDAYFAAFVVYTEMTRAGVRPLTAEGPFAKDMRYLALYLHEGDVSPFDKAIRKAYEDQGDRIRNSGGWLRKGAIRIFDFLFDYTEDFETLDRKREHVAYWWDKTSVTKTRAAHQRALEWKQKWIGEHRHDDFAGQ